MNGHWTAPQITSTDCTSANVIKRIALPPTRSARRCSPRRQTAIVASTKKIRSNTVLSWPIKLQGFGTPTATETVSPPHQERCPRLVISRKLRFGGKRKLSKSASVRTPQTHHANHSRPARRQRRPNHTIDQVRIQIGSCPHPSPALHCA